MNTKFVIFAIAFGCLALSCAEGKTVFRRADKISENFKQLSPDEIDPNVAPPEPQKVEVEDETLGSLPSGSDADTSDVTEGDEANEIIDESGNEVENVSAITAASGPAPVPAAAPAASPAASPAAPVSSSVATTASPAVTQVKPTTNKDDQSVISKYCKCTDSSCNCCRNFGVPLLPITGPGCAKITYLGDEKMSVAIKYGDLTLATRTISGKKAKPICLGMPGGYSKFCGRVYGLSRAKENFKACLRFELRAEDEVEAALPVSCFRFGPEGLRVADAEPLPVEVNKEEDEDDDDIFGLGGGDDDEDDDYDGDDDDDDDEDAASGASASASASDDDDDDDEEDDDDTEVEAPEDVDYGGFSLGAFLDELDEDDEDSTATKPVVVSSTVDQTRTVKQNAQSKADAGAVDPEVVDEVLDETVGSAVTPAPAIIDTATTVKAKTGKKAKKNKKKKAAAVDTDSDFALEIINGILDFFN